MENSYVENEFINWCKTFGKDYYELISGIFIDEYSRYANEYSPLIEQDITNLYSNLHKQYANINYSLRGRFKSKRSFLIKTYCKLAENIEKIFSTEFKNDEKNLSRFFSFIAIENPETYNSIINYLNNLTPESNPTDTFSSVLSLLSAKDRNNLIRRLGRTEDTFAYKILVHSVDYEINNITIDSNGKISFLDSNNNIVPIHQSIKINPDTDIHQNENGLKYILLDNGKKIPFNENNLLFDSSVTSANRNLKNAKKDSNGNITILGDSFVLPNGSIVDITDLSYFYNFTNNSFYIKTNGKTINLSELSNPNYIKIRKYDEDSLIKATYDISFAAEKFHESSSFKALPLRKRTI